MEDVRGTLQPYHTLLRGELERHGGTVEKFIGDAVMALFGAPVAHEDDPERAVRAALAIQAAVAGLRERDPRLDLHVRIGVNTGEALVALDATPASGQGMASGDVVNTAARLESAAPVDGVLVGEATFRATNHVVEYTAADPIAAKGKHDPVPGWLARRARSRFGSDVDASPATALVGRERELRLIRDAVDRAHHDRTPQLVTLVGVPGIGKSRLVSELFQVLDGDARLVTWRQGRSPMWAVLTFVNGGWVALILADIDTAHDLYQEGLVATQALGSRTFEAGLREGLAEVAFHRGRWAEGRSLADPTVGLSLHRTELMSGSIDAARRALEESAPFLHGGEAGPRRELELLQAHCLARLGEARLASHAIAGMLDDVGGLLGTVGCGLLDLAVAASLADAREAAANAIAEQQLVTPWSRAAAAALRSDWDEALQLVRTIGSLPYEAALLDLALAGPAGSRDAETARRARMREIRAIIPELAVGGDRALPAATSAADAG